ncbi:TPA: phage holin [Serratia fonticola]
MEKYSSAASYVWSLLLAIFGGLSLNEWAVLVGILTGLGTYLTNRYYKRREEARRAAEHAWHIKMFKLEYEQKRQAFKGEYRE